VDPTSPEVDNLEDQGLMAGILVDLVASPIDLETELGIVGEEGLEENFNPITEQEIPHLETKFILFGNNNMEKG